MTSGQHGRLVEVRTRVDDAETAGRLAQSLVASRLAVTVHVSAEGATFYLWEGQVHADLEIDVLAVTTPTRLDAVRDAMATDHPYEVPTIEWQPIDVSDVYADFVEASLAGPS